MSGHLVPHVYWSYSSLLYLVLTYHFTLGFWFCVCCMHVCVNYETWYVYQNLRSQWKGYLAPLSGERMFVSLWNPSFLEMWTHLHEGSRLTSRVSLPRMPVLPKWRRKASLLTGASLGPGCTLDEFRAGINLKQEATTSGKSGGLWHTAHLQLTPCYAPFELWTLEWAIELHWGSVS